MKKYAIIGSLSLLFPVILLFFMVILISDDSSDDGGMNGDISFEVQEVSIYTLEHKSMVEKYAEEYGISEYVSVLLAIIEVESGGLAEDVMQSSESAGLPPNSLSTEESIKQGCKYFSDILKIGENKGCDIWTVIQSYNFGSSYINYVSRYGNMHTYDLAKNFANNMASGEKVEYNNPVAVNEGYWRYNYGNMYYVELVKTYLVASTGGGVSGGTGAFIYPLPSQYTTVSSPFGWRNCPYHGREHHDGVDIVAPAGTDVYASKSGTVTTAKFHNSLGNYIIINHNDGTTSQYNHCSKLMVNAGSTVSQGQVIAKVGSTGTSTGAHLDFRITVNGQLVNPLEYVGK